MKYSLKQLLWQCLITPQFFKKLEHNRTELTGSEKMLYTVFVRPFFKDRFFFEGCPEIPGQMYIAERKALYEAVRTYKPEYCCEFGTWAGGGSTFFFASALKENGKGVLLTLEKDINFHEAAKQAYEKYLPEEKKQVTFILGDNSESFEPYLQKWQRLDCAFLDGSDNPQETVDQYTWFLQYAKTGSILMLHDWQSQKMSALRPLIEADQHWEKIIELKPPVSVGFVIFKRR